MHTLNLVRFANTGREVIGAIFDGYNLLTYTLEPPWNDNQRGASCIPPGEYKVSYMKRSGTGKYRDVYWVREVPNRSAILIHKGNTVNETLGCILPGAKVGKLRGQWAVLDSRGGLNKLHNIVQREEFTLNVRDNNRITG